MSKAKKAAMTMWRAGVRMNRGVCHVKFNANADDLPELVKLQEMMFDNIAVAYVDKEDKTGEVKVLGIMMIYSIKINHGGNFTVDFYCESDEKLMTMFSEMEFKELRVLFKQIVSSDMESNDGQDE